MSREESAVVRRVLLVDDDPLVLNGLIRTLRKEPFRLETACDAETALRMMEAAPFDVVLADQQMPGASGTELLGRIRLGWPDTIRMMLTGEANLQVAIDAINEGRVWRFFTKPANVVDIAVSIRQALRERELLLNTRRLLEVFKHQRALIDRLEEENPGIGALEVDAEGSLRLPDRLPEDREGFLREVQLEIDRALARPAKGRPA